jgi:endonuclease/exonuclease/phosphatase (EEP) superfamily protein YafD
LIVVSAAYAGLVVAVLGVIHWLSDRWWPATMLMFAPRALFILPVLALAAIAGWQGRQRLWWLHGATALLVLGPLMGLSIPFSRLVSAAGDRPRVRILALNQGSGLITGGAVIRLIERQEPDIICFQEHYTGTEGIPDPALEEYLTAHGWQRTKERAIVSRWPIVEELPPLEDADIGETFWRARMSRARVRAPSGAEFVVASVHLPSMFYAFHDFRSKGVENFKKHMNWRAERTGKAVATLASANDLPLLVAGDFNMPADSTLMADFSLAGLRYAFDAAGWGYGYTRPSSWPWVRIDHILASDDFTFTRAWVGPDVGSDHLPVLAEAALPAPQSGAARASAVRPAASEGERAQEKSADVPPAPTPLKPPESAGSGAGTAPMP